MGCDTALEHSPHLYCEVEHSQNVENLESGGVGHLNFINQLLTSSRRYILLYSLNKIIYIYTQLYYINYVCVHALRVLANSGLVEKQNIV